MLAICMCEVLFGLRMTTQRIADFQVCSTCICILLNISVHILINIECSEDNHIAAGTAVFDTSGRLVALNLLPPSTLFIK